MSASPITPQLPAPFGAAPSPRPGSVLPPRSTTLRADVISAPRSAAASSTAPSLKQAAHRHGSPANVVAQAAAHRPSSRNSALVAALLAVVPAADRSAAATAIPAILEAARRTGTSDPNRIGYLLATAQTESDFGANMTETGHSKAWFNTTYGCQDGNRQGTDDGYAFRGRGYVQTTHAGRYAELSHRLGLPDVPAVDGSGKPALDARGRAKMVPALVAHPEKLAEPKLAARALVVGVLKNLFTHNPNAALDATVPVGKKPGDVDFYHARGIVNGIVESQAQAIAHHATVFAQVLDGYRHSVLAVRATK